MTTKVLVWVMERKAMTVTETGAGLDGKVEAAVWVMLHLRGL